MIKVEELQKKITHSFKIHNFTQEFYYKNHSLYSFQENVNLQPQPQFNQQVQISNTLYQVFGDHYKKIIEIHHGKQLIVIEQNFEINKQEKVNHQSVSQKLEYLQPTKQIKSEKEIVNHDQYKQQTNKLTQIKEQPKKETANEPHYYRKDKKNVVKNIVKSFLSWLKTFIKKQNPSVQFIQAKENLENLLNRIKFNQRLINSIIDNVFLKKFFKQFLTNFARQWISSSKVNDKESHLQKIEQYMKSCNYYVKEEYQ